MHSLLLASLVLSACAGRQTAGTPGPAGGGGLESGVYSADQAAEGEGVFVGYCSGCHSAFDLLSPGFPSQWRGRPISQLYDFVKERMPENDPGVLSPEQTAGVIAYMLSRQGFPAGEERLSTDPADLASITISPPGG
jgi:mono/diheme cytochrome c family protein